jgi:hypothetical protein
MFGLVGILNLFGFNFLCVIKQIERVAVLNKANINKITGVKIYPFNPESLSAPGVSSLLTMVTATLHDGFYFAYGYDLTASR